MYFGAIHTLSRSIAVQELVRGVSLLTVSSALVMSVVTVLYKRTRLGLS